MTKAIDIMTEEVAIVRGSSTVEDAVKLMKLRGVHSLIVDRRHDEDAYGIVTDTDIAYKVVAFGKDPSTVQVYEIMTKPCVVVNPNLGVEYVARLFAQTGIDRAPVIQGDLIGIISVTDILTKGDFLVNPKVPLLEKALQSAIANARELSAAQGNDSEATAQAWEVVNEVEAELAFYRGYAPAKTAQQEFGSIAPAVEPVSV